MALFTQFVCPTNEPLNLRVSMSHNLTLLSSEADKMFLPSAENSILLTAAVCPLIVLVFVLVPGYQSLMRVSSEPLASTFSFGEKHRLVTFLVCPTS